MRDEGRIRKHPSSAWLCSSILLFFSRAVDRLRRWSFNYFPWSKSYCSRPQCAVSFEQKANFLQRLLLSWENTWKQQYGQSVRQQCVHNMSSKDRPGTLPINAYEESNGPTELFDVSTLQSGNAMESACQEKNTGIRHERNKNDESNTSHVLAKVGEYGSIEHGYSPKAQADKSCPFFVIKLQEGQCCKL